MELEHLGTIKEIWRYPLSSMGGEQLQSVDIDKGGISGDRIWCIADVHTGEPAAPEKEARWRPILFLQSRLRVGTPEIGLPDGAWLEVGSEDLDVKLSRHFGFDVSARPYEKAKRSEHGSVATNRYDPSPLHLLTTGALDHLGTLLGEVTIDSRRFRPTVLLETSGQPDFVEKSWIGLRLQLGQAVIRADEETKRCGMTLVAQPGLPENPEILRTILRQNRRNLGIYCTIDAPGLITVGDAAYEIVA